MKIITIANHKGGTGKTETVFNLAAHLSNAGHVPLLIDLDPQANLTSITGAIADVNQSKDIGSVLTRRTSIRSATQTGEAAGHLVDVVASHSTLTATAALMQTQIPNHHFLREALGDCGYEYVLIDTKPDNDILVANALVAADEVIIPIKPEATSISGAADVVDGVRSLEAAGVPAPSKISVVLFGVEGHTNRHKNGIEQALDFAQAYGVDVIGRIPKCNSQQLAQHNYAAYAEVAYSVNGFEPVGG